MKHAVLCSDKNNSGKIQQAENKCENVSSLLQLSGVWSVLFFHLGSLIWFWFTQACEAETSCAKILF